MKQQLTGIIAILFVLTASGLISAQDSEDNIDFVLDAFNKLSDGYTYTAETTAIQIFTSEDDSFNSTFLESVDGQVDADENYYISRVLDPNGTTDVPENTASLFLDHLLLDETLYLRIGVTNNTSKEFMPLLTDEWQSLTALVEPFEEMSIERLTIENIARIQLPSEAILRASLIDSIEELPSETVDEIEMRVFELEMDAFAIFVAQSPVSPIDLAELLLDSGDFLEESEFQLTHTIWIGAEDGNIHQWETEGYNLQPYLTTKTDNLPYDIENEFSGIYIFSNHGEADPISDVAEQVGLESTDLVTRHQTKVRTVELWYRIMEC